jgi:threonine/homoserine/homoserine lactone efflux protein
VNFGKGSVDAVTALVEILILLGIGLLTPGPNALTCFSHSGLFGRKSNIKLITGMAIGFISIELFVGLLVHNLEDNAQALHVLHWIGMIFLALMAFAMFRIDPSKIVIDENKAPLGLKTGILMQYVNGKEWAFIIIMMSQFMQPFGGGMIGIGVIVLISLTICVSAMIGWTFFGHRLNNYFTDPVIGKRIFNISGILLSLLWVAFLFQGPPVPVV